MLALSPKQISILNRLKYYIPALKRGKISDADGGDINLGDILVNAEEIVGTLTQAQLLALHDTPIHVVPQPGAGKAIMIDEIELFHNYSTAHYCNGGDVKIEYCGGCFIINDVDKTIVTNASSTNRIFRPNLYDLNNSDGCSKGFDIYDQANKGIDITNQCGNFTDGDVANILKYRIRYHVVLLLT